MSFLYPSVIVVLLGSLSFAAEVDFDTEVVPLLSKAGCNAASCHGSAAGQGGFRLSLFGGDADFDYRSIVRERQGRRINQFHPDKSLVVAKPTGQLDHGGGELLDIQGPTTKKILRWIDEGSQQLKARRLERLEVTPSTLDGDSVPRTHQLRVTAFFTDGQQQDVTHQAVYTSQDESSLQISETGLVKLLQPGRQNVIVKFIHQSKVASFTTPIGKSSVVLPTSASRNWIDDYINATLARLRLSPAPPTDDASFLRRLSLDLTGRLPSPARVKDFLRESDPKKREHLIDELLESEEFTEFWTHRLATQLRLRKPGADLRAANAFYDWIKLQVANDIGWNQTVASLVMAEGDSHETGPATVHRLFATAREEAEYMSEVFMGVRLRCANCHNHPLDKWTQNDYHGLAAIFAGMERTKVVRNGIGTVTNPRTGEAAEAQIPGDRRLTADEDRRNAFVDWLTEPTNPYFAKAMSGRIWESLMGRGLVTPVDDLRETNPPSHPKLFQRLSDYFVEQDYKLRPLVREICNSAAYQRSSTPPDGQTSDEAYLSQAVKKQLSAEVLADAISDVTGVANDYDGVKRAIFVVDRSTTSSTLQFLGQCLPGEGCQNDQTAVRGIASKLHLMNGEMLNTRIRAKGSRLSVLLDGDSTTKQLVEEFFLRALSRPPTKPELSLWIRRIDSATETTDRDINATDRAERCEDFVWALLNCVEFTTNH